MDRLDPASVHAVLPALVERLGELGARRVILYGSRARGDAAPRSDIDLAVDAPAIDDGVWMQMEDVVEEAATLYKIDCVRWQNAPESLKSNIVRDGKVLYERTA